MLIRVKYKKIGDISYISHLDVVKLMERIARRAKLKLAYSEGFNPHPKIAFSPALQLGVQSECEFVDMELSEEYDVYDILALLNEKSIEGIVFTEISEIEYSNSLVAFITHSVYKILVSKDNIEEAELISGIESINSHKEILLTKKSKKGNVSEYNMKDFVGNIEYQTTEDEIILTVEVCSGSEKSINPKKIMEFISESLDSKEIKYTLVKTDTYNKTSDSIERPL